jgi:hypothetical protein
MLKNIILPPNILPEFLGKRVKNQFILLVLLFKTVVSNVHMQVLGDLSRTTTYAGIIFCIKKLES